MARLQMDIVILLRIPFQYILQPSKMFFSSAAIAFAAADRFAVSFTCSLRSFCAVKNSTVWSTLCAYCVYDGGWVQLDCTELICIVYTLFVRYTNSNIYFQLYYIRWHGTHTMWVNILHTTLFIDCRFSSTYFCYDRVGNLLF